jgi:hypothetical protein
MFTRIALLFGIFTTMGLGGYMTGHFTMQHGQEAPNGVPHEHPLTIALEAKTELQLSAAQVAHLELSAAQVAHLEQLRAAMFKELEPVHARLQSIHERAAKAHETGDRQAMEQIEKEVKAIEAVARPIMERFTHETIKALSPEQHQKLGQMVNARMANHGSRDFVMMFMMEAREQLGITPQQFTKLQYLQADFIRAFAPLREELETMHMQFMAAGKTPSAEDMKKATELQKRVKELQNQFTNRAIKEVLNPEQRQRLEQLLQQGGQPQPGNHDGGQHGTGGNGGGQHGTGG